MTTYTKYFTWLCLAFLLVACNREHQEPQAKPSNQNPTSEVYTGPTQDLRFDLEANLDEEEARAYEGLETGADSKLYPAISNSIIKAIVVLANDNQSHIATIDMKYDATTRKVFYKGVILGIPDAVLEGTTQAMVAIYPDGWYNGGSKIIGMQEQFVPAPSTGKPIDIKVPYFSEWKKIDIQKNPRIPTDIKGITFKPQGQVIRLIVTDSQTELSRTRLHKFIFESNVMSRSGSYSFVGIQKAGDMPTYIPSSSETLQNNHHYRFDVKLKTADDLNGGSKTYYMWVTARPNVTKPYTRTLMSIQYFDPVLDPSLNRGDEGAWWSGKEVSDRDDKDRYKFVVAGYNNSPLTGKGATYRLELNNQNGFSPITRFSSYYMSEKGEQLQTNRGHGTLNPAPALLQAFKDRFYPGHARYTYANLVERSLLPDYAAQELTTLRSPVYKNQGAGLSWRIPSSAELLALLPSYSNSLSPTSSQDIFLFQDSNLNKTATVTSERVVLGGKNSVAQTFSASYRYSIDGDGHRVDGVRFMGGNQSNKCWYTYRRTGRGNNDPYRTQVQVRYLGKYYPEITNATELLNFKGILPDLEERIIAWNQFFEDRAGGLLGNYFWVSDTRITNGTPNGFSRVTLNHLDGSITLTPSTYNNSNYASVSQTQGAVMLIRDYK